MAHEFLLSPDELMCSGSRRTLICLLLLLLQLVLAVSIVAINSCIERDAQNDVHGEATGDHVRADQGAYICSDTSCSSVHAGTQRTSSRYGGGPQAGIMREVVLAVPSTI